MLESFSISHDLLYSLNIENHVYSKNSPTESIEFYKLTFIKGHRVSDVAADFSLRFHLNMEEIVQQIYDHACGVLKFPEVECDSPSVNALLSVYDISALWQAEGPNVNSLVYVRQNYSAEELATFYCYSFNCPEDILERLTTSLRQEISTPANASTRFDMVYEFGLWGRNENDGGLGSGPGSSLTGASDVLRELPRLLQAYDVSHVVDLGCGSMNWMAPLLLQVDADRLKQRGLPSVEGGEGSGGLGYTGVDVSLRAVHRAEQTVAAIPAHQRQHWRFVHMDISAAGANVSSLFPPRNTPSHCPAAPTPSTYLVVARHIFFHLEQRTVARILLALDEYVDTLASTVAYCGAAPDVYLLATNHLNVSTDDAWLEQSGLGAYRAMNLNAHPFFLRDAIEVFGDNADLPESEKNRVMGLWKLPLHGNLSIIGR